MASPPIRNPDPDKVPKSSGGPLVGAPPPPVDKKATEQQKFIKWARSIGATAKQAGDLWYWAGKYSLDPYYWASVIKHESDFDPKADSGQAYGIGQIAYSWIGKKVPWNPSKKITEKDLEHTGFNIRFSAYLLADAVSNYGYDGAYTQGYNPNDPNRFVAWDKIQKTIPKGRVLSPTQGPGTATPNVSGPDEPNLDPWVTGVKKGGKLSLSSAIDPPKGSLKFNGLPMRHSDFLQLKRQMEETYVAYTGKRPSNAQIQQFVLKGWSGYKLTQLLSGSKSFTNSPLWKSKAPGFEAAIKDLLAPGEKVDKEMVRKAIVNNWDTTVLQAEYRKRGGYVNSNEFKGMAATMTNVYQSIYGTPSEGGLNIVKEATLGGWSPDQFAAWLRSRDEYVYTPEYRAKAVSLVEQLGFLTGNVAVLKKTQATPPKSDQPGGFGPLPNDPRIKGPLDIPGGPPLAVGAR